MHLAVGEVLLGWASHRAVSGSSVFVEGAPGNDGCACVGSGSGGGTDTASTAPVDVILCAMMPRHPPLSLQVALVEVSGRYPASGVERPREPKLHVRAPHDDILFPPPL